MLGALLASLVRQRTSLVRHEPHRLNNPAPLILDGLVLRTHQLQQHRELGTSRLGARGSHAHADLLQLRVQLRMKVGAVLYARSLVFPDNCARGARAWLRGRCVEGPYGLSV